MSLIQTQPEQQIDPRVKRWHGDEYDRLVDLGVFDGQRLELIEGVIFMKTYDTEPYSKRWTGAEYDRLVDLGVFDGQRLELIDGEIYEMSPMNDPHAHAIRLVDNTMRLYFPPDSTTVQVQCPMRLGESARPEPDVAVVSGSFRDLKTHPTGALLIIEVSDSTLYYDRVSKASLYARHDIRDYWIVNLRDRVIEVRRDPSPVPDASGNYQYAQQRIARPGETLSPIAAPTAQIAVNDLLP